MADIYDDARLYDALGAEHSGGSDLSYWQRQCARFGGPALELACGSGRLTVPLAEGGADIEGLDISPPMLALAREKSNTRGLRLLWHLGDMADFAVDRRFSFIFLPNNSVAHLLDWLDLVSCLNRVKRHLKHDGWFALDYFNPSLALLTRPPGVPSPFAEVLHPETGEVVTVTETSTYDAATQINHIRWHWRFAGGRETTSDLPMRVYFPRNSTPYYRAPGSSSRRSTATMTCRRSRARHRSSSSWHAPRKEGNPVCSSKAPSSAPTAATTTSRPTRTA